MSCVCSGSVAVRNGYADSEPVVGFSSTQIGSPTFAHASFSGYKAKDIRNMRWRLGKRLEGNPVKKLYAGFRRDRTKGIGCAAHSSSDSLINSSNQEAHHADFKESDTQPSSDERGFRGLALDEETADIVESRIEQAIFDSRFLTLMAVAGSLLGSFLCFAKGCIYVSQSFSAFFKLNHIGKGKVILLLVEALDVYLVGTVMLIFGIGIYELFVCTIDFPEKQIKKGYIYGSSLFGLFRLRNRPRWLEIHSLDALKTKLGHVIVMVLLVNMFEKSKKAVVQTSMDLLLFSVAIFFSSLCLFVLSRLNHSTQDWSHDLGLKHK